jgi:transcriptional regulator with XRE-family HTH domain
MPGKSFGETLKELRIKAGMTQKQLSEASGLSQNGISQLENGNRDPVWSAVQSLARALGVSSEALRDDGLAALGVEATKGVDSDPPEPEEVKKPKRTKKGNS